MGKKAGRLVKTSALTGDGSSSLSPTVEPHSSPTRSESPPCTPNPGKTSSSVSLPRKFTRSMSIPFASTKAHPPPSTTSPLPPAESDSSQPPLSKPHPKRKHVSSDATPSSGNPNFVWNGKELPITVLSEFYRILHKIAMSNWWANSHISTINHNTARFLYTLGTGVSIDLPTLMYDRIMSSASAKSIKHTLPYPSLINRVVKRGSPVVYEQDKILLVPSIGKSFNPVHSKPLPLSVMDVSAVGASLMEDLPSAPTAPSTSRDGTASTSWQSQLITTVTDLATSYARDQLRQRRFEKSIIDVLTAMVNVLKESEASPAIHSQGIVSSSYTDGSDQNKASPGLSPSHAAIDPSAEQSQPQTSADLQVPLSTDIQGAQVVSPSDGLEKEIDSRFQQGADIEAGIQGETSNTAVVQGEPSNVAAVQGEISTVAQSSAPDGGDSRILGSCAPLVSYSNSD
ncbi:hypothetical protein CsatB_014234 [Cannabis sativa]